jgi:hypothetical protein
MAFIFITKGKTNWKYLLIVFVFGIIIGAGSLWFSARQEPFYQPPEIKKSETASWKTYNNEEYKYEVKYPNDWVLDEKIKETVTLNSPENEKIRKDIEAGKVYGEGYMRDIIISYYSSVSEEPENKANKFGAVTIDELIQRDTLITPLGQITFAGEKAYEVIWGGFGAYYSILIEKNNHLYVITFGNQEDKSKLTEIEKQILSTFRFIDIDETTNWKTYSNPKANFTFRYPKDWEIREDYFYKTAVNPTVIVCRKEEPTGIYRNCIQINMPQFPCEIRSEIKGNWIGICVENPEILKIYEELTASFKVIEIEKEVLPDGIKNNEDFIKLIKDWQVVKPTYTVDKFAKVDDESFSLNGKTINTEELEHAMEEIQSPYFPEERRENVKIYSPDRTKFIFNAGYPYPLEIDQDIVLFDLSTNKYQFLKTCGTACWFEKVFWINNNQFVVIRMGEYSYPDKYEHSIFIYDLEKTIVSEYKSSEKISTQELESH